MLVNQAAWDKLSRHLNPQAHKPGRKRKACYPGLILMRMSGMSIYRTALTANVNKGVVANAERAMKW